MEECEALCGRIGILVGGRLRCIGSAQHLKSRYGQGYQIDINTGMNPSEPAVQFISNLFVGTKVIEQHANSVKLRVLRHSYLPQGGAKGYDPSALLADEERKSGDLTGPSTGGSSLPGPSPRSYSLADLFGLVEEHRQPLHIQEYSISESTLEQIFLHFAKQQQMEEDAAQAHSNISGNDSGGVVAPHSSVSIAIGPKLEPNSNLDPSKAIIPQPNLKREDILVADLHRPVPDPTFSHLPSSLPLIESTYGAAAPFTPYTGQDTELPSVHGIPVASSGTEPFSDSTDTEDASRHSHTPTPFVEVNNSDAAARAAPDI